MKPAIILAELVAIALGTLYVLAVWCAEWLRHR